jgi:hypothetical protein
MAEGWSVRVERVDSLPPMAWLLSAAAPVAVLAIGSRVRQLETGIFEGSWVGPPGSDGIIGSTMPFGSGVVADGEHLWLVPPGHTLEGIYICRADAGLLASNSLAGLLALIGADLLPGVAYPVLFDRSVKGLLHTVIPTTGPSIETCFHDNLRLGLDGRLAVSPKPREAAFTSYADHRARLSAALASVLANAPGYEPVVTISSGYDGAAVAVLAREHGCRRALTIAEGKPVRGDDSLSDSGAEVARMLGLEVTAVDRLAYRARGDLPEAELLASGFTGEEVTWLGMEPALAGTTLVSGFFGDGMWWMNRPPRPPIWRSDQSGSSLAEWRLRVGFVHVPLPCFGAQHHRVTRAISYRPEMQRWVLGVNYDRPIPRRILEEAGVPRGSFGARKRAASGTLHVEGPAALAPATRAALERFAAAEGGRVEFRRRHLPGWRKAALKLSRRLGAETIAARFERYKLELGVMEPAYGSLLLRWAVAVVRPRYEPAARRLADADRQRSPSGALEVGIAKPSRVLEPEAEQPVGTDVGDQDGPGEHHRRAGQPRTQAEHGQAEHPVVHEVVEERAATRTG